MTTDHFWKHARCCHFWQNNSWLYYLSLTWKSSPEGYKAFEKHQSERQRQSWKVKEMTFEILACEWRGTEDLPFQKIEPFMTSTVSWVISAELADLYKMDCGFCLREKALQGVRGKNCFKFRRYTIVHALCLSQGLTLPVWQILWHQTGEEGMKPGTLRLVIKWSRGIQHTWKPTERGLFLSYLQMGKPWPVNEKLWLYAQQTIWNKLVVRLEGTDWHRLPPFSSSTTTTTSWSTVRLPDPQYSWSDAWGGGGPQ